MQTLTIPSHSPVRSLEEERDHRKLQLAAAFRIFGGFGFDEGVTGHITARDPELTDHLWVNPWGVPFGHIRVSDLCLIDAQGNLVAGPGPVNPAAFTIHASVHEARPDVVGVAHSHSLYGKTWASFGRLLDPITQDACSFYGRHSVFADYNGVVLDDSEGKALAAALGENRAAILQNHGILTVGSSVESAAWWFVTMERSCQAQLLAEAAGTPHLIPQEIASGVAALNDERAGVFNFQALFVQILRDQPDLAH